VRRPIIAVLFPGKFPTTFNGQARLESGKCGRGFDASLKRRQNFHYSFFPLRFFDRFGNDETVRARPDMRDAQVVACSPQIRGRKLLRATLQMRARLRVLFTSRISGVEG